ncbi:MAG TPA: hypothetical protein VFA50_21740 [Stellaceae bacterium]|nr:hypothetical protein [Stellaceae bacterium]
MNAHPITRADLYELVWQKPVTQAAKQFGVSDVGLRKICSKHDIPTPPLGYWAKLAHGKKVYKPPLPPLRNGISDRIYVTGRPFTAIPDSVAAAAAGARDRESAPENRIKVESERPEKLHRIAAAVEKAVRKAKPDDEGFKTVRGAGLVEMSVGTESAPRAIRMLDAVLKAATARSHAIVEEDGGVRLLVDDERFVLRLYETKDRRTHVPTAADQKRQAQYDNDSKRFPTLYPPGRVVWASWDHFPSGRLALEIRDPTQYRWNADVVGRWYDRKSKKLEDCLGDAFVALVAAAAQVKHRRAEEAEKARLAAIEQECRRRAEAMRERAKKRRDFLDKMADQYAALSKLRALAEHLESRGGGEGTEGADRLAHVLRSMVTEAGQQFEREALNAEVARVELFADYDPV